MSVQLIITQSTSEMQWQWIETIWSDYFHTTRFKILNNTGYDDII